MITAARVKALRERTGAGMLDCRKALEATGGDIEAAIEKLRMEGAAKADKKAARVAADGAVAAAVAERAIALVEVNCETDFVARGEDFRKLAANAAQLVLQHRPADAEALLQLAHEGQTLDERRRALVARLGENMTVRRFAVVEAAGGALGHYLHGTRIGVAVALSKGDAETAKDIAIHVAASRPQYLAADEVPGDVMASERRIAQAQAEQSGKPAAAVAKMIEGRLRKFLEENTLLGQPFVKDPDRSVEQVLKSRSAAVARFVRFEVGEGIEKKESDFAAEVKAAAAASMK